MNIVEIIIPDSLDDICGIYFGGRGWETFVQRMLTPVKYPYGQGKSATTKIWRIFVSMSKVGGQYLINAALYHQHSLSPHLK